jgi:hypothetical protein
LAFLRILYKSKCSTIEVCCIKVTRQTDLEERIDELALERHRDNTAVSNRPIGFVETNISTNTNENQQITPNSINKRESVADEEV